MVGMTSTNRSATSSLILDNIKNHSWGLMLLDEVHVAPADMFRTCMYSILFKSNLTII